MSYQEELALLNSGIEKSKQELLMTQEQSNRPEVTWWSTTDAMTISATVLLFGFFVCVLAAMLLRQGKSADNVLKTLGTILIIVAALFLVVAGYSNEQIAPVIGLLGTIAGYLLGKGGGDNKI